MAYQGEGDLHLVHIVDGIAQGIYDGKYKFDCALNFDYGLPKSYDELGWTKESGGDRTIKVPFKYSNGTPHLRMMDLVNRNDESKTIPEFLHYLDDEHKAERDAFFAKNDILKVFHEPRLTGFFVDNPIEPCGLERDGQYFHFTPNHYRFLTEDDKVPHENGSITKDRLCSVICTNGLSTYRVDFKLLKQTYRWEYDKLEMSSCNVYQGGKIITSLPFNSVPMTIYIYPKVIEYLHRVWQDGFTDGQSKNGAVEIDAVTVVEKGGYLIGVATKETDTEYSISIPACTTYRTLIIAVHTKSGFEASREIEQKENADYQYGKLTISLYSTRDISAAGGSNGSIGVTYYQDGFGGGTTWIEVGKQVSASNLGSTPTERTKVGTIKGVTLTMNGVTSNAIDVDIYQEANKVESYTYGNLTITSFEYARIPAAGNSGNPCTPDISYTQSKSAVYTSGGSKVVGSETSGATMAFTSTGSGATVDRTTGAVTCPSANTSTSVKDLITVTVTATLHAKRDTASYTVQQEGKVTYTYSWTFEPVRNSSGGYLGLSGSVWTDQNITSDKTVYIYNGDESTVIKYVTGRHARYNGGTTFTFAATGLDGTEKELYVQLGNYSDSYTKVDSNM